MNYYVNHKKNEGLVMSHEPGFKTIHDARNYMRNFLYASVSTKDAETIQTTLFENHFATDLVFTLEDRKYVFSADRIDVFDKKRCVLSIYVTCAT